MTTLTLQPDATEGIDTSLPAFSPNALGGGGTTLDVYHAGLGERNSLIKLDLTSIPSGSTIDSAILYLTVSNILSNWGAGRVAISQILSANSAWIENSSWNYAVPSATRWAGDVGNNGGSDAGCSVSGTDFDSTPDADQSYTSGAADAFDVIAFTLTAARVENLLVANYGWQLRQITSSARIGFFSSDHATEAYRPKLVVTYTAAGNTYYYYAQQ